MVVYRNGVDLEVTLTSSMRNSKIYSVSATEHQLHSAHETTYSKPKKSFGRKVRDELRRAERKVRRLIPMSVRNGYRSLRSVMKTGRVSFRTFSKSRTSQKDLLQDSHHMKEILQQQIETVQAKFSSLNCRFQEQLQQVRKNLENRHSAHQQEIARVQKQILQLVQANSQLPPDPSRSRLEENFLNRFLGRLRCSIGSPPSVNSPSETVPLSSDKRKGDSLPESLTPIAESLALRTLPCPAGFATGSLCTLSRATFISPSSLHVRPPFSSK